MLLELHIKNFALIDKVDMRFAKGLNVLTGETGAGKSILIDSVNFILGDKQSKDIIRRGEEFAFVEAVFEMDNDNDELANAFEENGIDVDDVIIISREISLSGRSISRINGRTVTIGLLKQVGKFLIDIHGQHEHQSLLNESSHIDLLDSFCGENFRSLKKSYLDLYLKTREIQREIDKLAADEQLKLRRMDLLSFQIQEISEAGIKPGEDAELEKRKNIVANAEKIFSALSGVYKRIYENEDEECAYDEIGKSIVQLESISGFDEEIKNIKDALEDLYYKLEDVIENIRDYKDRTEYDPAELDEIERRLDIINRLKRKYGNTVEEIIKYYEDSSEELSRMEKSEEIIRELNEKKTKNDKKLIEIAEEISSIRRITSEKLKEMIEKELKYLGMEKAIFKVEIREKSNLGEDGKDEVFFMMTANPGEPLRQLSRVASGGEMSRIMLAIKSVIADVDKIPTLIFDEIDIGISGRTAQSVAEKMCQISGSHQLLSVTHLPQIASMADNHFKIQKNSEEEKTTTSVFELERGERVNEIARMLSGTAVTELTRNHAMEFLELANSTKAKIRKH